MNDYVALVIGVLCAGIGGELFVRGVVGVASWARVPAGIVAATFAAFATSSPELAVSVTAALAGSPNIALGDALGSNVVNVALILGLALLVSGIRAPRDSVRRDFPVALVAPGVTAALALDGRLSRLDGAILFGLFLAWLVATTLEARRRRRDAAGEVLGEPRGPLAVALCVVGLVLLVAAGQFIVAGAKGIATDLGLDEFVVGATVVALATGTPELATTIISRLRGHEEVGLGTILGSNVFNGLFIVSVAVLITPFEVRLDEVAVGLIFGALAVAVTFPRRSGLIERRRGVLLVALYAAYLAAILQLP